MRLRRVTGARSWCGVLALSMVLCSNRAHADVGPAERETARQLLNDGDQKVASKDLPGALDLYLKAHAIMHVPTTGLEVARTYGALGKLVEARDTALEVTRMNATAGENAAFARARSEAAVMAEQLATRIPTLLITVKGADTSLRVTLDGSPVSEVMLGVARALNPGKHRIEASASGFLPMVREVELPEAAKRNIELVLEKDPNASVATKSNSDAPPPIAASTAQPSAGPVAPVEPEAPTHTHVGTYIGFGVGALGLGLGTVTGIMSLGKTSDVKALCNGNVCPSSTEAARSDAKTLGWVSNISFAAGLVGIGLGTYFLLAGGSTPTPKAKAKAWEPVVSASPSDGYLGVRGAF